jgi:cytochrome c6
MFYRGAHRGTGSARSLWFHCYCAQVALMLILNRPTISLRAAEEVREVRRGIGNRVTDRAPNPSSPPTPAPTGAAIAQFRAHCINCHDADGRAESGRETMETIPDFTDPTWQASRSDQQFRHAISEGKGKGKVMPSWKRKLAPAEIERMIVVVRRFSGGRLVVPGEGTEAPESHPSPPEDGPRANASPGTSPSSGAGAVAGLDAAAIFRRSCQTCHGPDGRAALSRDRLPGIPDFTSGRWHQGRSRAQLTASILEGKGSRMPSFRGKLGAEQVDALVSYVRAFGPPQAEPPNARPGDFDRRLDHLQREFEGLRRAYRELAPPPVNR